MKSTQRLAALCLPALLLGFSVADAATSGKAIEACTGAIANYYEDRQGKQPQTKIELGAHEKRTWLSSSAVYEMDVYDSSTQAVVGRFTCLVNSNAKVRKLTTLPLDAPEAQVRGRG